MTVILTLTANPAIDVATSVERLEPGRKLRCSPERRDPGGGGVNVARVAHRLGAETLAIYPSGGIVGQLLERLVHERDGLLSVNHDKPTIPWDYELPRIDCMEVWQ